eukprot:1411119-Ditylum_brightwellii.AAC.1
MSGLSPFGNPVDVMQAQHSAFVLSGLVVTLELELLHATLPCCLRGQYGVHFGRWLWLGLTYFSIAASACLGIELII